MGGGRGKDKGKREFQGQFRPSTMEKQPAGKWRRARATHHLHPQHQDPQSQPPPPPTVPPQQTYARQHLVETLLSPPCQNFVSTLERQSRSSNRLQPHRPSLPPTLLPCCPLSLPHATPPNVASCRAATLHNAANPRPLRDFAY
ncbi:hypothetical protein TIFTF001_014585 [Ficus carica]|uniref:Uncharacterized protein n=1 Tax=Ficus carica TaxID=3494 RepID=A0AA88D8A8_FICCA|nr:hypothetical protein TIFTF001_014585 [Ficus carica]